MTCEQVNEFLDDQVRSLPASLPHSVAEHCRSCERCRKLIELLQGKPPLVEVPLRLQAQITASVLESLQPVSQLPRTRWLALGFLGVFVFFVLPGLLMMGTGALQFMSLWQFAGVGLILGAGIFLLAVSLSWLMVPASSRGIRPQTLVFLVGASFPLAVALLFPWNIGVTFLRTGLRCTGLSLMLLVPAGLCFWLIVRRGTVLSPSATGATIGLLAGLVGAVVLHFGCVAVTAPHLIVWHAGVPIASALGGFISGKFFPDKRPGKGRRRLLP